MNVRKFAQGFVIFMVLGAGAAVLHAQEYRVFAMGTGAQLFDKKYYNVYGAALASTYKIGDGYVLGGERHIWKNLGVEGSYAHIVHTLVITNFYNSSVPNAQTGYDIANQRISLDAVAHSPKYIKGVKPYLSVGVELDRFGPSGKASLIAHQGFNGVPNTVLSTENRFGYNFGFGLEIKLLGRLAARVDLRDHIVKSPTFGLPSQATSSFGAYYPIGGSAQDVEASAGFVFLFGK